MEKVIIVLMGLVAMAAADCGPLDRLKVKTEWAQVYGTSHHRTEFGLKIFHELFATDPKVVDIFKKVNGNNIHSSTFKAHASRVLGGLDMCISLLDDEATLNAELAHLNKQHKDRGIDAVYFTEFGKVLLDLIPGYLDHSFDYDAWSACYKVIADGITG